MIGRRSQLLVSARSVSCAAGCALALLAGSGCGAGHDASLARAPTKPTLALSVPWHPLARQPVEADTLYLLDARAEQRLAPGTQGGLIASDFGTDADAWGNTVVAVSGRYREGLTNIGAPHPGYAWMPAEGLLGADQFTVELRLKSSVPWSMLPLEVPFAVEDSALSDRLQLQVGTGEVTAYMSQTQRAQPTAVQISSTALAGEPANQWIEVALTLKDDELSLFLNGALAARTAGAVGPREWSDGAFGDGLSLLGADGRPTVDLTLSDLRISRLARLPGQRVDLAPPTVTVDTSSRGQSWVPRDLLGVLQTVGSGRYRRMVAPSVGVIREDKLLSVTPIKAGPPDAAHPSLGASGRYSYDWRVVDRTMRYIVGAHAIPYISMDPTPSLLGGSVPPFSGPRLHSDAQSYQSPFPPQVPDNLSDYTAMVGDLVHHIVDQDRINVPAWGLWNEPDLPVFWSGTLAQYEQLYAAVAPAVKAADPSALIGGPEIAKPNQGTWLKGFIETVATQHLPLDFISFHYYTGSVGTLDATRSMIDQEFRQYGMRPPRIIVGEWNWDLEDLPLTGYKPFRSLNFFANDWAAAFDASSLIAMQRDDVIYAILASKLETNPNLWSLATPSVARAPLNAYRIWSTLGSQVLPTGGTLPPGTSLIATREANGEIAILIADLRYRRDLVQHLTLRIPGVRAGATVTADEVDRQHSDSLDAGVAHAGLARVAPPKLARGHLAITLAPDSVLLLRIGS
jgi:hypothetical protein